MRLRPLALYILFSLGAVGFAQSAPPGAVVPLVMLGRSPAFFAKVNGHKALLELDTGSFELRLSPKFVADNSLDGKAVQVEIGDKITESARPLVENLEEASRPTLADRFVLRSDGIVGLDVLRKYAIGIDAEQRKISFWPGGNLSADAAEAWTAITAEKSPMTSLNLTSNSLDDWYHLKTNLDGRSVDMILDTGTAISTINPSVAATLHLKQIGETEVEEIGHNETLSIVEAESLTFGALNATFPILNVESEESKDSDGILGTEAIGQGKYIIDMPQRKLFIRRFSKYRNSNMLEARMRNAGLDFFPDTHNNLVVMVAPASSAAKAGIKSGDHLQSLGKVSVTQLLGWLGNNGGEVPKSDLLEMGMELLKKNLVLTVLNQDGRKLTFPIPTLY